MRRSTGRISRGLALLLVVGAFLPAHLPAQTTLDLRQGDKLRLTRKDLKREVLLFQACRGDTLVVSAGKNHRAFEVARSEIDLFEVLVPGSPGRGALHGAGIGGLVGGGVGFVVALYWIAMTSGEGDLDFSLTGLIAIPVGAIYGGIIGGIIGLGVSGEKWMEVKPPIRLDCGPGPVSRAAPPPATRNIGMSYPVGGVEPELRERSARSRLPHLGE